MKLFRRILRDQRGFTLLELVIAVVVISLLAGIAILNVNLSQKDAVDAVVKADMRSIATALKMYKLATDEYPDEDNWKSELTNANGLYKPMLDEIPYDASASGTTDYSYTKDTSGTVTLEAANGDKIVLK
ncbi:MAG TPA: prepilin-type N-terminal cleavage/methylation domain-containing protein [Firmicutes bacterium]|jgi:general secretion pathway protein G|nr:prepilin-type N-terminal cleavage/methylation domain-containing protein [Bacillota bacterium]